MNNEQSPDRCAATPPRGQATQTPTPPGFWRGLKLFAAIMLCGTCVTTAVYFLRPVTTNGQPGPATNGKEPPPKAQTLFAGWPKPDLAILVSGEQHGFLKFCGCSNPQLGGLPRRYNFMQSLLAKGWPLVAVDVGEIAQASGPQAILKYEYSMRALREMNYSAVGLGKTEFNMPLMEALGRYTLNNPKPAVLATNLKDPGGNFAQMGLKKFHFVNTTPQLGFFNVVDSKIEKQISDPQSKFFTAAPELANVMLGNRASVNILIYQGTDSKQEVGKFISDLSALRAKNPKIPHVPIILSLTSDPEPPQRATVMGSTTIVSVGHKGRYVGVIGLFRNPASKGFDLKYELVPIEGAYETPPNLAANHPIMKLLEQYAHEVEAGKYIEKFPRSAHHLQAELRATGIKSEYVGSKECRSCHADEFQKWKASNHSHAFGALVNKAKDPGRRQFDGECVVCHTVGFQYSSGYLSPGNGPDKNALLENVGCESCHGPGSAHIDKKNDETIRKLMNPYSTTRRIPANIKPNPNLLAAWKAGQFRKQDDFCQKCHDQENDVHWTQVPFSKKWAEIEHYRQAPAVGGAVNAPAVEAPVIKVDPMPPMATPPLGPPPMTTPTPMVTPVPPPIPGAPLPELRRVPSQP